jgi:hypothetical protein
MQLRWLLVIAALAGASSCKEPAPPAPYEFTIRVESDPGRPMPGAQLVASGKVIATTNAEGRATVSTPGTEGDAVDIMVKCPDTYASPTKPVTVQLKRLADNKRPEYPMSCPPSQRRVVLAVRAENGAHLPVKYFGREVTRTDASGAAHYMLDARPGDQIEIMLATTERGFEGLRPQNPTFSYVVKPQDEVVLFDARFQIEKKPVMFVPAKKLPKEIPSDR